MFKILCEKYLVSIMLHCFFLFLNKNIEFIVLLDVGLCICILLF